MDAKFYAAEASAQQSACRILPLFPELKREHHDRFLKFVTLVAMTAYIAGRNDGMDRLDTIRAEAIASVKRS